MLSILLTQGASKLYRLANWMSEKNCDPIRKISLTKKSWFVGFLFKLVGVLLRYWLKIPLFYLIKCANNCKHSKVAVQIYKSCRIPKARKQLPAILHGLSNIYYRPGNLSYTDKWSSYVNVKKKSFGEN